MKPFPSHPSGGNTYHASAKHELPYMALLHQISLDLYFIRTPEESIDSMSSSIHVRSSVGVDAVVEAKVELLIYDPIIGDLVLNGAASKSRIQIRSI